MPYCKECGKKLFAGDKFCPFCGTPVSVRKTSSEVKTRQAQHGTSTWAVIGLIAAGLYVIILASWLASAFSPTFDYLESATGTFTGLGTPIGMVIIGLLMVFTGINGLYGNLRAR